MHKHDDMQKIHMNSQNYLCNKSTKLAFDLGLIKVCYFEI